MNLFKPSYVVVPPRINCTNLLTYLVYLSRHSYIYRADLTYPGFLFFCEGDAGIRLAELREEYGGETQEAAVAHCVGPHRPRHETLEESHHFK